MKYRKRKPIVVTSTIAGLLISAALYCQDADTVPDISTDDVMPAGPVSQTSVQTDPQAAKYHVESLYYAHMAESYEDALSSAGLSDTDIYDVVDNIGSDFADCVVGALQKTENGEASKVLELTANGAEARAIFGQIRESRHASDGHAMQVYDYEVEACLRSVDSSYGTPEY